MTKIEFIPLIELATLKDAQSEIVPTGTSLTNPVEWDIYQKRELDRNYLDIPDPVSPGIYQYRLFELRIEDIERAIKLHIGDTDINESCSFFGGYAISVNGRIELYPQCCGLLEEIQEWKSILNENFSDFCLKECHPSPLITKKGDEIIILCNDEPESFVPLTTKGTIKLDYLETKRALKNMLNELVDFSKKLNVLSSRFDTKDISNILIWGSQKM